MTKIVHSENPLAERFADINDRIAVASRKSGASGKVKLVAISKTHPASVILEALQLGATDFGENKVQEAEEKINEIGRQRATWHLVGHLQANKARRAVRLFHVIQSIDSVELAARLDRLCSEENREELKVLIQVDLGGEATKTGIKEENLPELVTAMREYQRLRLIGLMTLPPFFDNPEDSRPFFRKLRHIRGELYRQGVFGESAGELSMGMTHDFEIAIEEGATMVRVGTALFGSRT